MPSNSVLPGKRRRASSHAQAIANGRANRTPRAETLKVNHSACNSASVSMRSARHLLFEAEAGPAVHGLRLGAVQEVEEALHLGPVALREDHERIAHRRMRVGREGARDVDLPARRGVGAVDDPEWRLA